MKIRMLVLLAGGTAAITHVAQADVSHWICADSTYFNPSCWDEGIPSDPGEGGVIDFDNLGTPYTVTFNGNGSCATMALTSPDARWFMQDSTFNPAFSFSLAVGTQMTALNSDFVGQTGVYNNAGTSVFEGDCIIDLADMQQDNLLVLKRHNITNGSTLTFVNGFTNNGTLSMENATIAVGSSNRLDVLNGVIQNNGLILMNTSTTFDEAILGADIVNDGGIVVHDEGVIDKVQGVHVNNVAIEVRDNSILTLRNALSFFNDGTVDVLGTGSTFTIEDSTFDNSAGAINVSGTGAECIIDSGGVLSGGVVNLDPTARIRPATLGSGPRVIENVTLNGRLETGVNPVNFILRGTLVNNGQVLMTASFGSQSHIRLDADATIMGGEITSLIIQNAINNVIETTGSPVTLTLDNVLTHGILRLGNDTIGIVNQGTVAGDVPGECLIIDPDDGLGFDNTQGLLTASAGGTLDLQPGPYLNTGSSILADDGGTIELNSITLTDGVLRTVGTGQIHVPAFDDTSITDVTIDGVLDVPQNATLTTSGTINLGTVALTSTLANAPGASISLETDTTFVGGLIDASAVNALNNRIDAAGAPVTLTLDATSIQGICNLGIDALGIVNQGDVTANVPGGVIEVDPDDSLGFDNTLGLLAAENGGTLRLRDGLFSGGTVQASDTGLISFDDGTFENGIVRTVASGRAAVESNHSGSIRDMTLDGTFDVEHNAVLSIGGTIQNLGTLAVNSIAGGFPGARVLLTEDTTILGGQIVLSDAPINNFESADGGTYTLTLGGVTVSGGAGALGDGDIGIVSTGVLAFNGVEMTTIDVDQTLGFHNHGALNVGAGADVRVTGPMTSTGSMTVAGTFVQSSGDFVIDGSPLDVAGSLFAGTIQVINGGAVSVSGSVVNGGPITLDLASTAQMNGGSVASTIEVNDGTVIGEGFVQSIVQSGGRVEPGNGIGFLEGDFYAPSGGTLAIEIGGTMQGTEYDVLQMQDRVVLQPGATLEVTLVNGFAPLAGDVFTVIDDTGPLATDILGTFDTHLLPDISPLVWAVVYNEIDLGGGPFVNELRLLALCGGDFNGDGITNTVDVLDFLNAFAAGDPSADFNGDGLINTADVLAFLNAFTSC